MRTYLFVWNPGRWDWDDLDLMRQAVNAGDTVTGRWSCGVTKKIIKGDRAFLIRLGRPPKGIIGSGHVISDVYPEKHWDPERAERGEVGLFVKIAFDCLLESKPDLILPREELNSPPFQGMHWDAQSSGVEIPAEIAGHLEARWSKFRRLDPLDTMVAQTVDEYLEGNTAIGTTTRRKRNAAARAACLADKGLECTICRFDFEREFGPEGSGIIYVHHLRELASFADEHPIDPIRDLIPICPNCHAMIHSKSPMFTPSELRDLLDRSGGSR